MQKRKQLKYRINKDEEGLEAQLQDVELTISKMCSKENRDKVIENFKEFGQSQGSVNANGMWNVKKKIFPKNNPTKPTGKKNSQGQIITSPDGLKDLYLETYIQRLRHRPIREDLKEIKELKDSLFYSRLELSKRTKSKSWKMEDLDKVLHSLKTTKARDPLGLVNNLFKPEVMGLDLKQSLLMLVNQIKEKGIFPDFVQWTNIVSLFKGKGDRLDLANERGIFLVTVFRSIIMKLIYNEKYDILDQNMSDSNVGARKEKNIRNHIFVLNGVIMDILNSKSKSIDIQILDYKQCFDSMWLEETLNDLYEGGMEDDHLATLYEANKKVKVSVKTPHGLTSRKDFEKIIMQGDVFGPIQCSMSVDTYGKECLAEKKHCYSYKGEVDVPPLAMVDDLLIITECGYKATMANSFINTKSNLKKLQFGTEKCHKMHVGKKGQPEICPDLFVDGWQLEEVTQIDTGEKVFKEVHVGSTKMDEVIEEKYLGDIISHDGKNTKNIISRVNKGVGISNQIMSILEEIYFGPYYFEVAIMLRNSLFISSLLSNSEAWYNLTREDIDKLEQADEILLRRILQCPFSTPKEMLYLELNCLPIRFIIMGRRINFLSSILKEGEDSLIFKFLMAQLKNPSKSDWGQTVISDLEYVDMDMRLCDIAKTKTEKFKEMVKKNIQQAALNYLNKEKSNHNKVKHIPHNEMKIQDYLSPNELTIDEAKCLFITRSRMLEVRTNYSGSFNDLRCPLCKLSEDTQQHLLECPTLHEQGEVVTKTIKYSDLFSPELNTKITVARIIKSKYEKRKKILRKNK